MEIIAHRGASDDAPENTLAAVHRAWQQKADAVEIDVCLSKDNHIVAIHDETTGRLAGRDIPVKEQTLAELKTLDVGRWKGNQWAGQRIPTLQEVLETIPPGKRLFVEVKTGPEISRHLTDVLSRTARSPAAVAIIGFCLPAIRRIKSLTPDLHVYLAAEQRLGDKATSGWIPATEQLIDEAQAAQLDGLDLNLSPAINEQSVVRIRQAHLQLYAWTVNSLQEALRLQSLDIDGITTDRPGWLRQQLPT